MYKVVVVDDEKFARQNLVNTMEFCELNLEIVAQASNGQEALKLIEQNNPDIVITDIKMPLINGIDLIEQVKVKFPKTYFIILSGYDDFQYMKEAVKLGVEDYIRKPVEEDELKETLVHVIEKLDNDEKASKEHYRIDKKTESALFLLKANLLNQLVHNNILSRELQSEFIDDGFSIFIINNVLDYNKSLEQEVINRIEFNIQQFINNNNLGSIKSFAFKDNYNKDAVIIVINGASLNNSVVVQVKLFLRDYLDITLSLDSCSLALSPIFNDTGEFHEFYQKTMKLLKNNIIVGSSSILNDSKSKMTDKDFLIFIYKSIDDITQEIKDKSFSKISVLINDILSEENKIYFSIDLLECVIIQIGTVLKRLIIVYEVNLPMSTLDTLDTLFFTDLILRFKSLSELKNYMIEIANDISVEFPNFDDSNVVDKVLTYINTNYNTDLVLSNVAKEFFINSCYLSSLFKSKIGINFSTYIENIRISKAEELLRLDIAEISEVAYKVGYHDPNYFSKIFKKKTGLSPSLYLNNVRLTKLPVRN